MLGKIKYLYNVDLNFKLSLNIVIICIIIIILKQFSVSNNSTLTGGYFPPVSKTGRNLNNNVDFKIPTMKKLKAIASLDDSKIEKRDQNRLIFTEKEKYK